MDASFRPPCATDAHGIIPPALGREREGGREGERGEDCARLFHGTCSSNAFDYYSRNIRFGSRLQFQLWICLFKKNEKKLV